MEGTSEETLTAAVSVWETQEKAGAAHRETLAECFEASTGSGSCIYSHTYA